MRLLRQAGYQAFMDSVLRLLRQADGQVFIQDGLWGNAGCRLCFRKERMVSMDIGHRMKELRIQYGLTQQELADRSELSKGFISQLERNLTSPSVSTLLDIIQCLGTTPAEFFTDQEPEQIVFRQEDYFEKENEELCHKVEWVIPNAQKNVMEPVRMTLQANGASEVYLPHETEEFGYVLKGAIRLFYGTSSYVVRAGESFYFKAGKKHHIENNGSREAVVLWISAPPSF